MKVEEGVDMRCGSDVGDNWITRQHNATLQQTIATPTSTNLAGRNDGWESRQASKTRKCVHSLVVETEL